MNFVVSTIHLTEIFTYLLPLTVEMKHDLLMNHTGFVTLLPSCIYTLSTTYANGCVRVSSKMASCFPFKSTPQSTVYIPRLQKSTFLDTPRPCEHGTPSPLHHTPVYGALKKFSVCVCMCVCARARALICMFSGDSSC